MKNTQKTKKTVTPWKIPVKLQSKQDLIYPCSENESYDVIPFLAYLLLSTNPMLQENQLKTKYVLHTNKENNVHNIVQY